MSAEAPHRDENILENNITDELHQLTPRLAPDYAAVIHLTNRGQETCRQYIAERCVGIITSNKVEKEIKAHALQIVLYNIAGAINHILKQCSLEDAIRIRTSWYGIHPLMPVILQEGSQITDEDGDPRGILEMETSIRSSLGLSAYDSLQLTIPPPTHIVEEAA